VTFYATDEAFSPVADMIHRSGKAFDVFQVARTFLAEPDRFIAVLRKNPDEQSQFYSTALDDLPFLSQEDALGHLLRNYLDSFFDRIEEEREAPKGNFTQIARCPFTKKLIGAPNHHSYKELLQEHFWSSVRNMPFDRYCERLEFTNGAEDIAAWLEQMKKGNSYQPKDPESVGKAKVPAEGAEPAPTGVEADEESADEEAKEPRAEEEIPQKADGEAPTAERPILHSLREVRAYLLENADRFLRARRSVRLDGKELDSLRDSAIRQFVDYCWDRQKRFPLDTAGAMRNKFKQHKLYVFKRGKRGPSYVTPVARKFREKGSVFTPELDRVLSAIEKSPQVNLLDLVARLGSEGIGREEVTKALKWLLREGYVTEFEDGTLLTYPPMEKDWAAEKSKKPKPSSKGAHLEHLTHGQEEGSGDEGDGAGEEEYDGGLQDGGEPLDGASQLLFQDICGVEGHGGESSATFADGNEPSNGGRDDGRLEEQFAEGDALAGADRDGLEIIAECYVSNCPTGEAERLREGNAVAQGRAQGAEKEDEPLPADEVPQQRDAQQ
jgi:hypothetical protein